MVVWLSCGHEQAAALAISPTRIPIHGRDPKTSDDTPYFSGAWFCRKCGASRS